MFIGHFAMGLVASRVEKRLALGTALLASQLPDAIWPYLLLTGAETVSIVPGDTAMTPLRFDSYPWSHSLLMTALAGFVLAGLYRAIGGGGRAAAMIAGLAVSHWFLDFITHRPDMPVLPWSDLKLGLGMWHSVPLTVLVEGLMYAGAVLFYAYGRRMSVGFWILIAVLGATYVANVVGPPPPGVTPVALSMVILVPIVWWWGNKVGAKEAVSA
ncbi:MAG: hypothetical protein K1Y01_12960 [Vicinamibacteria bacterium]|nr:hypothetical protein [Vicinamibacteria bacterium]